MGKNKSKTKAEKAWLNKVSNSGCVICRKFYNVQDPLPANCHHIRSGMGMGQKNSHDKVIPLCWEHHQGNDGFHHAPGTWQDKYGTELELLEYMLNNL
tara:strand:+ start:337 stop:630 length:294 start_codon:yes stop_codon:yes gene_type:complete